MSGVPLFPIKRIDQICVVVRDIEESMERYWSILGIGPWRLYTYGPPFVKDFTYRGKPTDSRFKLALAQMENITYELIQPLEGPSLYQEFLDRGAEGLQHFGVFVPNLQEAIAQAQAAGLEITQYGHGYGLHGDAGFAYLESEGIIGTTIELIELPSERQPPEAVYPS